MRTRNIFIGIIVICITIASCKKKEETTTAANTTASTTTTTPTSNYYNFDGVTYTGNLGSFSSVTYSFYCSNAGGDQQLSINFKPSIPGEPKAGTYPVINPLSGGLDSTNCSISVKNAGTTYTGTGAGSVTVGKSGSQTTYVFSNIALSGSKTVSGNFIY